MIVKLAMNKEVTWLVELVKLPIRRVFACPLGTMTWVVC